MLLYLLLFFFGLIGGFFAGLIGIGGGVIYIFILPYLLGNFGVEEQEMVQYTLANSIFGTLFAALSGWVALWRKNEVYLRQTLVLAFFAVVISLLLLEFVVHTSFYQVREFNLVVVALMLFIIYKTLRQSRYTNQLDDTKKHTFGKLAMAGGSGGVVAALSGLGGGTVIIPILNIGLKMSLLKAKSISLGVIFVSSLALTAMNLMSITSQQGVTYHTGYIIWPLALIMSFGVIIGSPYGVHVARKLNAQIITRIFIAFVVLVIIDKLYQLF